MQNDSISKIHINKNAGKVSARNKLHSSTEVLIYGPNGKMDLRSLRKRSTVNIAVKLYCAWIQSLDIIYICFLKNSFRRGKGKIASQTWRTYFSLLAFFFFILERRHFMKICNSASLYTCKISISCFALMSWLNKRYETVILCFSSDFIIVMIWCGL